MSKFSKLGLRRAAGATALAAVAALGLGTTMGTGAADAKGSDKKTAVVRLPPGARRYLQANIAVAASGGDNTAKSVTLSLLT